MIYLSGAVRRELPPEVGLMITPMMGHLIPEGRTWGADTGCFAQPDRHDDDRYLAWLQRWDERRPMCLFATAPDVLGDAHATLPRSLPMLDRIRDAGYPAALVGQDGLENEAVPWDAFDALFLGGTTAWKLGGAAARLTYEAKARGKWVHMGRVNSLKRLRYAEAIGCDSADGTFLAFAPDKNLPRLQEWLATLRRQPLLFGA